MQHSFSQWKVETGMSQALGIARRPRESKDKSGDGEHKNCILMPAHK